MCCGKRYRLWEYEAEAEEIMLAETEPSIQKIWTTLERIRWAIGITETRFADLLRLNRSQISELKNLGQPPSIDSIESLLDEVHLSFEKVMVGEVDYAAISANYRKENSFVSHRYREGAYSKRRTSIPLLTYLRQFYGENEYLRMMKHFQIRDAFFQNPNEPVNVRLITDFLQYLKQKGYPDQFLYSAGRFSFTLASHEMISKVIGEDASPRQIYEKIDTELKGFFDSNFIYQAQKMEDDVCVVSVKQNEDVEDALKQKVLGSREGCIYRLGVISSFPGFSGLPAARTREVACIYRGDPECVFEIDYSRARYEQQQRHRVRLVPNYN